MKHTIKIAIVGGTGKAGKYLVTELLKQEYAFRMLVRNAEHLNVSSPLIEPIIGSAADYITIEKLLTGCDAVLSTLGLGIPPDEPTLFRKATDNILKAMQVLNIQRYIVITGLNVDTPFDNKSEKTASATAWMKQNFPVSTANKQEEYELLQQSSVNWTLIRLPMIEQTDQAREIRVSLTDCPGDKISATDLAIFMIAQLYDETYVKASPFIASN